MLANLKVRAMQVQAPPHPVKIQSLITVNDFRRYTPRVIQPLRPPPIRPSAPVQRQLPSILSKPSLVPPRLEYKKIVPQHQYNAPGVVPPPLPKIVPAPPRQPTKSLHQLPPSPIPFQRPVNSPRSQPVIVKTSYPPAKPAYTTVATLRNIGTGRILIMIAAGPSVNEVDFNPIKGHPLVDVMCINQPHQALWPTKFWAFCDHSQYNRNKALWESFNGIIINSTNVRARKNNQYVLNSKPGKGFSLDASSGYHIGRSSTYANMQVAHFMNYSKIYIFGVDMTDVGGVMHYYGQNPDVANEVRKQRFADEAEHYLWMARNVSEVIRNKFTFCSSYNPWPFMNHFARLDQKEAVADVLKYAKSVQK
jgi:hypothetical protein